MEFVNGNCFLNMKQNNQLDEIRAIRTRILTCCGMSRAYTINHSCPIVVERSNEPSVDKCS